MRQRNRLSGVRRGRRLFLDRTSGPGVAERWGTWGTPPDGGRGRRGTSSAPPGRRRTFDRGGAPLFDPYTLAGPARLPHPIRGAGGWSHERGYPRAAPPRRERVEREEPLHRLGRRGPVGTGRRRGAP